MVGIGATEEEPEVESDEEVESGPSYRSGTRSNTFDLNRFQTPEPDRGQDYEQVSHVGNEVYRGDAKDVPSSAETPLADDTSGGRVDSDEGLAAALREPMMELAKANAKIEHSPGDAQAIVERDLAAFGVFLCSQQN
jgi:hypothetical protein